MPRLITLPNGLRIAIDAFPGVRSCAMGLWLEIGSRHETPEEAGLAHFAEHMFFKGTPRLNALELSDELNRLGGQVNAHTSQEALCLHARCVDAKAPRALDLLCEMLLDSTFPEEEIARERRVILEEYKMYEDNPDDVVADLFFKTLWPDSPLGRPVIGLPKTIRAFSASAIRKFLARELDPSRVVVSLAGKFSERECLAILRRRFGALPKARRRAKPAHEGGDGKPRPRLVQRPVEQAHFCFGATGPERGSPDRFAFGLMNMILGGGMSSRLFKEAREKRGLVYSIYSFAQPFKGVGSFGVHGSTSPESFPEVMDICGRELRRLLDEAPDGDELDLAKEQIVDSLLMSVESAGSRMSRLADAVMNFGRLVSVDEAVKNVKKVRPAEIRAVARKYLTRRPLAGAFVGPKGMSLKPFNQIKL